MSNQPNHYISKAEAATLLQRIDTQQELLQYTRKSLGEISSVIQKATDLHATDKESFDKIYLRLIALSESNNETDFTADTINPDASITPPTPPIPPIPLPTPLPAIHTRIYRILFIVGHNPIVKGAYSETLQQHEHDYFLKLARKLEGTTTERVTTTKTYSHPPTTKHTDRVIETSIIYRTTNISRKSFAKEINQTVKTRDIDLCIELHFNAFHDTTVSGCEVLLHSQADFPIMKLATNVCNFTANNLGIRNRGLKLVSPTDNGYTNVTVLKTQHSNSTPYLLLEPFFGSNPDDCEIAIKNLYAVLTALKQYLCELYGHKTIT